MTAEEETAQFTSADGEFNNDIATIKFKALALPTDSHDYIPTEDKELFFETLRAQPENRICFDCAARNASWISVSLSIYLCLTCSGQHRNLGSKVSFIRSTELDDIRLEEALKMEIGGNARAKRFFRSHGVTDVVDYRSKTADKYKRLLEKEVLELLSQFRPEFEVRTSQKKSTQGGTETTITANTTETQNKTLSFSKSKSAESASGSDNWGKSLPTVVVKQPQLIFSDTTNKLPSSVTPHQVTASSFFGSTAKAQQRPKADDFDFDFDNAFAASQTAPPQATSAHQSSTARKSQNSMCFGGVESGSFGGYSSSSKAVPIRDLSNAKSISAADFRDSSNNADSSAAMSGGSKSNVARFKNAQAISSDAFFNKNSSNSRSGGGSGGGGQAQSRWSEEEMATRLAILREGAIQKATEMAGVAQETFRNAANWFSRVASSPSYP